MSNILFLNFLDGLDSTNTVTFSEVLDGGYSSNVSFDGSIDGEGSEQRIEKRISSIVSKHIPEFTRTQNPLFVKFLRYYYEFLEQDFNAQELLQNINSYADIDRTVPSFVYYFLQNYGSKIPTSALIDKRFLVKKLNDLYQAKGSLLSFQSLFRLLYDEEISINYPYENVLRASDGEFVSKFCIGVTTEEGDTENIEKRFLTYNYNGAKFESPIVGIKSFPQGITEIQIDAAKKATNYVPGEFVYVYDKDKNVLFKGNIRPTINDYSVVVPGSNFKIGQVYAVNYGPATGTLLKINKLTSNKGVAQVKIINFGYNYPDDLELNILPNENTTKTVEPKVSSTRGFTDEFSILKINNSDYFLEDYLSESNYIGNPLLFNYSYDELTDSVDNVDANNVPIFNVINIKNIQFVANSVSTSLTSNTLGTTDFFSANIINSSNGQCVFSNVFSSALVSNALASYANIAGSNSSVTTFLSNTYFSTITTGNILIVDETTQSSNVTGDVCTLILRSGGLAKYPGSYISSRGFISERDINLQDNLLNQPFAYQINSELDISSFYNIVIDLVHPAGYILFNNKNIRSNVDVSANVGTSFRETVTKFEAYDSADPADFSFLTYIYEFSDTVEPVDNVIKSFSTTLTDLLESIDNNIISFTKNESDDLTTTDFQFSERNTFNDSLTQPIDSLISNISLGSISDTVDVQDTSNNLITLSTILDNVNSGDLFGNLWFNVQITDTLDPLGIITQIARAITFEENNEASEGPSGSEYNYADFSDYNNRYFLEEYDQSYSTPKQPLSFVETVTANISSTGTAVDSIAQEDISSFNYSTSFSDNIDVDDNNTLNNNSVSQDSSETSDELQQFSVNKNISVEAQSLDSGVVDFFNTDSYTNQEFFDAPDENYVNNLAVSFSI